MTIERINDYWDLVCDAPNCLPEGKRRAQTLKQPPEESQDFVDAIGWLTTRLMVTDKEFKFRHLCPFCAAHEGHPENLAKLSAIFHGKPS